MDFVGARGAGYFLLGTRQGDIFLFYHDIGFFMVLVDTRQPFRCAGQHFMCVATGPPIRGPD